MMGTKARDFSPLPPVSLNELVPPDHVNRHLERTLDLTFVRDLARGTYAEAGRPSIDPVVFCKLQLILFFEGLRSERQLMRVVADRLSLRWYLGYDLTEPLPGHSSLTRTRQRLGIDVFQRFFEKIVDLCQEAGLVWGRELYVDATKVEANAALDSLAPRFFHEAKDHVADLFADEPALSEWQEEGSTDPTPSNGLLHLPVRDGQTGQPTGSVPAPRWKLLEERRLDPRRPAVGSYRRTADFRGISPLNGTIVPLAYHVYERVDCGWRIADEMPMR